MMRNYNMIDMEGAYKYLKDTYDNKVKESEVYLAYYYEHHK